MGKLKLLTELGQLAVAQRFFWVGYYAVIPLSSVLLSRSMSFSIDNDSSDRKRHLDLAALSMITFCLPMKSIVRVLFSMSLTATAVSVAYSQVPSQVPLLVKAGAGVSPNVMLTLDDSGSMQFQHLPENVFAGGTFATTNPVGSDQVRWETSGHTRTRCVGRDHEQDEDQESTNTCASSVHAAGVGGMTTIPTAVVMSGQVAAGGSGGGGSTGGGGRSTTLSTQ